jgi:small subunit ribosomal protein S16
MVKIRLSRIGAKGQPYYRVVVVDSRRKRDTKVIETVGHYNPRTEPSSFDIKKDRLEYWRSVGAQITEPVLVLLGEINPKRHKPKNVKENAEEKTAETAVETPPNKEHLEKAQSATESPATKADTAPEETPEASPELAKTIDTSNAATSQATSEEIQQTTENSTDTAKDVQIAKEREPSTQDSKADAAEVDQESDDSTEKK